MHPIIPLTKAEEVTTQPLQPQDPRTQTIEQTGKSWKGLQLGGCLLVVLGFFSCLSVVGKNGVDPEKAGATAAYMFMIGFALWIIGKVGGWWHHG